MILKPGRMAAAEYQSDVGQSEANVSISRVRGFMILLLEN